MTQSAIYAHVVERYLPDLKYYLHNEFTMICMYDITYYY